MFTTFPPRKEGKDWVLVPALFEPEFHPIASRRFLLSATTEGVITTRSNRMKFRLDYRHFSRILHLILAKIYGVPTNLKIGLRKQRTSRGSYKEQAQEFH